MATQDATRAAVERVPNRLLIDGEWRDARDGAEFEVEDPSTGEVIGAVAEAGPDDALAAMDAADRAQADWAGRPPGERADILRDAYDALLGEAETVATVMSLEMGKPLKQSHEEVSYAAAYLRWFSEEAVRVEGGYQVAPDGRRMLVMRQPLGPALAILPWNWPLVMAARDLAPALAAGCTLILKPSKETPYSTLALADLLQRAGLPPGVLNVIPTSHSGPVTDPLIADPRLRLLTFTGSGGIGQQLMAKAAEHTLRLSMELGGNAPFVVFEDADLDEAVEGALLAKVRNVGESCTAANRFLVAESLADEFAARLAERMGALRMGPGTDPASEVGPLINAEQRDQVAELVDDALARGARALTGGERPGGRASSTRPRSSTGSPPTRAC